VKLLVVAPYAPTPPFAGGRRRTLEQVRALGRRHEVDMACLTQSDQEEAQLRQLELPNVRIFTVRHDFRRSAADVRRTRPWMVERYWSGALRDCVAKLADRTRHDWVIAEHCYAAGYLDGIPVNAVISEHNIEYRVLEQISRHNGDLDRAFHLTGPAAAKFDNALHQLPQLREFERQMWKKADLCVTVSEAERQMVAEVAGEPGVYLAPNCPGLAIRESLELGPVSIVFIGALQYFPNVDAIVYLIDAILPKIRRSWPDVDVVIAGRDPRPELIEFCRRSGVRVVANPARIDEVMTSGSVLACPLRFGAGTRIKVLDAMAAGIPVVATDLAVEGLGVSAGREVLVGELPGDFADTLAELLGCPALRASLVEAGREFLKQRRLRWSAVFDDLERRLQR
jgi:glycosyltransferase involved in cell wall biosynthesis